MNEDGHAYQKLGMEILAKNLGLVEAERFIMLIQKEPFDCIRQKKCF
jgi:hypothetical protein